MSESQLERTFADVAYARLTDKAPILLDYLTGFQLIDKNDDDTRAVGIFAFNMGNQWLYAPVFFLNGELKGHELLWLKEQNMFVPLQENWVQDILNKRPQILGEEEDQSLAALGAIGPNLDIMGGGENVASQSGLKIASVNILPQIKPALQMLQGDPSDRKYDPISLVNFVKRAGARASLILFQSMKENPKLAEAVAKYHDLRDLMVHPECPTCTKQAEEVRIITPGMAKVAEFTMTNEDTEQVMRGENVVRDSRKSDTLSNLMKFTLKLYNPTESGCYEMLMHDGTFKKVIIMLNPQSPQYTSSKNRVVVIDPATKAYAVLIKLDVFVRGELSQEETKKMFDSLPDAADLKRNKKYIMINKYCNGTYPFEAEDVFADTDGLVEVRTWFDHSPTFKSSDTKDFYRVERKSSYCGDNAIIRTKKDGYKLTIQNGTIFVPKEFKAVQIGERVSDKGDGCCGTTKVEKHIIPGTIRDIKTAIFKVAELQRITLRSSGTHFTIQRGDDYTPSMSKVAATEYLMKLYRLDYGDAELAVKEATDNRRVSYIVKFAQGYAPTMPEYATGYDANIGVPQVDPQVDYLPIQIPEAMATGDQEAAVNAANSNQQEVMDTSILTGLARKMDINDAIDSYIPDLMLAMDRVGRILFMFYWHNEKFAERYGQPDMVELEDSLRNTFKSLGDLTIFLKEKTVIADPAMMYGGFGLDEPMDE